VVSLLNDARIAAGLLSLGFLNPWLYTNEFKGLSNIVGGNNPGCGTDGLKAIKGWDRHRFGNAKLWTANGNRTKGEGSRDWEKGSKKHWSL